MSTIQRMAEWVHALPGGAVSAEVAAEFGTTTSKASVIMAQIHREPRFETRVEYACLNGRHTRRLFIDQLQAPQWVKTAVVGVNAQKQTVRFASITEAELIGGFVRANIARCLRDEQKTHGGYKWRRGL